MSPRPDRLCRGLEAVGSLSRCEQEGGSCSGRGRRVQPPDAELGSPVPAACQLGLQKQQESLGRGLLLSSGRQPSQRGPFWFLFFTTHFTVSRKGSSLKSKQMLVLL